MNASTRATAEAKKWGRLCSEHLPVTVANSTWNFSRPHEDGDLRQGWKLHIAATILSANKILQNVAPLLKRRGVLFKAPSSLDELQKLNSGVHFGYCQVGKFITVYPRSIQEARSLAQELDHLTNGLPAPAVPFDFRLHQNSCIFYRYGSFESLTVHVEDGIQVPALRRPDGQLVPDARYAESARPHWVPPLFEEETPIEKPSRDNPLTTTFRAFQSLTQRGKGGVYKAFDFSQNPPRLCLLKEGRQSGETTWDGRDGTWLVKREEEVLRSLCRAGVPVPSVYASFEFNNNQYLVTEFIQGETLQDFLKKQQRKLPVKRVLAYSIQMASLLAGIHSAGWAWRDCKPANIIVGKANVLRPVDFEGACPLHGSESRIWSTSAFTPRDSRKLAGTQVDLYALGVVIYYLLTGRLPEPDQAFEKNLGRKVPQRLSSLISKLLAPGNHLDATMVLHELRMAINEETAPRISSQGS